VQDHRGRLIAVVVALWGVAAVTAVMEEGIHQSKQAQAPLQGVRRHDEVACPRPGGSADLGGDVKVVRGAIGFADAKHLVLDVSEREPKSYVFAMASATIRVSGKEGGVGNLRRGDLVGVLYTETEGERIAKMVLITDTEER
jgi:hypothetical protein